LLLRFFQVLIRHSSSTAHDLVVGPVPQTQRQQMTVEQFRAIYVCAPCWWQWLKTLGIPGVALRRVDLVNLRFDDVVGDRMINPIRQTDTQARDIEEASVDFPIHADVRRVIAEARRSSPQVGGLPVCRSPPARTANEAGRG
jgi:hypothetical protein